MSSPGAAMSTLVRPYAEPWPRAPARVAEATVITARERTDAGYEATRSRFGRVVPRRGHDQHARALRLSDRIVERLARSGPFRLMFTMRAPFASA